MSDISAAAALIARALEQGTPSLSEHDSKRVLSAYGVRVAEASLADTPDEAADGREHDITIYAKSGKVLSAKIDR